MRIWMKRILFLVISTTIVGIMSYAVFQLGRTLKMYRDSEVAYQIITDEVVKGTLSGGEENEESEGEEETLELITAEDDTQIAPVDVSLDISVDFTALQQTNADIVGWLYSPGTAINYPVVQGSDNAYYLTHSFEMKDNKCGCLFVDAENTKDYEDRNTIIHGHHMKNGSMFASLLQYQKQSYYNQHPVIFLLTPGENYEIDLFAGFTTSAVSSVYQKNFTSDENFRQLYYECMRRTTFNTNVDVTESSRIITLSTCDYSYDDARYVVMGIMKKI